MASNLKPALVAAVADVWPTSSWREAHVMIAVSGGADSVALLRAVLFLKADCGGIGNVYAAHLNHGLRGSAADADQDWLAQLCGRLGVALTVGRADVVDLAAQQGDGLEAAARDARYRFLRRAAEEVGARYVAVAHTADDQAETVLHRIARGTGLGGLSGMPASRPLSPTVTLVRPLLAVRRAEVLQYLTDIGQDYRSDESNADPRFTRNRLRHELLPLLRRQYNPSVDLALLRLAEQAGEVQIWIAEQAERLADACVVIESQDRVRIECQAILREPPFLIREVFKTAWRRVNWPQQEAGYEMWDKLAALSQSAQDATPRNLPGNIRAIRHADSVVLERDRGFS
jgi:tRNA(Ile)-lysidine synthase